MKKGLLILLAATGLLLTSCSGEKCACNTFGENSKTVKKGQDASVSVEKTGDKCLR